MTGLKVIAGTHRGRPLRTPRGTGTRPTAGRARQALFNILGDLRHHDVLDLYAGSGALGIEALSRGARRAVFVESNRDAVSCIRHNLEKLGLGDRAELLPLRVEAAPKALAGQVFDLILCDPPWAALDGALSALGRFPLSALLREGGRCVLEHPAGAQPALPEGAVLLDQRSWGDTGMTVFSR